MSANGKYLTFIEKLIQKTREEGINWAYLDTNKYLYQKLDLDDLDGLQFDNENSFFYHQKNTYIVLYMQYDNGVPVLTFEVIPNTFKNIAQLSGSEYQSVLTRLLNVVRSLFPTSDDYIDAFLEEDSAEKPAE